MLYSNLPYLINFRLGKNIRLLYKMGKIIGIFHIFIVLFQFLFPLIKFKDQVWNDKLYLIVIIIILLNWLFLKGECVISLLYKKMINNNYKPGSDVMSLDDIKLLLPFASNEFVVFFLGLGSIFIIVPNMWMVNNRSKLIAKNLMMLLTLVYLLFLFKTRKYFYEELYIFLEKNYVNIGLDILSILFLFYILYIILLR